MGTKNNSYTRQVIQNAKDQNVQVAVLSNELLKTKLPYMKIANNDIGVYEEVKSGHVSPRKLVEAEQEVAQKQGCAIVRQVVRKIERSKLNNGQNGMIITTDNDDTILCKNVLVTAGAFTTFRDLLPGIDPLQELSPLTVALVEVDGKDAVRLRDMPCIIYSGQGHPDWSTDFPRYPDGDCAFYLLPPIRYPDGRHYLKLGHFHEVLDRKFTSLPEVRKWFIDGDRELSAKTAGFIQSMFTGIKMTSWKADQCIIVETPPTFQPYIDKVHAHLGVALGGNGFAAKSCDEIGRLAAGMMFHEWNSSLPRDVFKFRTRDRKYREKKSKL